MKKQRHGHKHTELDSLVMKSGLRNWNATYKVLLSIAILITVLVGNDNLLSFFTLLFSTFLVVGIGKLSLHDYLHLLTIPVVFLLFGGVALALQAGDGIGQELLYRFPFWNLYVSRESVLLAVKVTLKAFAAVSALYLMTVSTPVGEIIMVLRKAHVPALVLELMYLIYHYIHVLFDTHRKQRRAAESRLGYVDFRTGLSTYGMELASLLILSLKKAQTYYDAMESRGYEGDCLFWEEEKQMNAKQALAAVCYLVLVILILAGKAWIKR